MKSAEPVEAVNVYITGGRLRILRRLPSGELADSFAKPEYSVFVRKSDAPKISGLRGKWPIKDEGDFVRVVCHSYEERDAMVSRGIMKDGVHRPPFFKERNVDTFEGDLSPVKRWLIDSGVKIQKPLPGYMDLENDSRVPFDRKGEARCLCWGLVMPKPDGTIDRVGGVLKDWTDAAEKELLLDLFFELCTVDQVLAWNGDRFDFPYLKERVERLGLDVDLKRWLWCDHMELFAKMNTGASDSGDEKASMALDRVAAAQKVPGKMREFGTGDLAGVKVGGAKTYEFWKSGGKNRELLGEYCVEDAMTMFRIEKKSKYVATLAKIAETTGVLPDSRGFRGVNYVESFLMRLGAERGERAPTKYYQENTWGEHEQFKGAYVFPTKSGLFSNVHICDFARLYPSIMQAWNMSPETWLGPAAPEGETITLDAACATLKPGEAVAPITLQKFDVGGKRGLFAKALDIFVEQRKFWSNKALEFPVGSPERDECERMDATYKMLVNTFYGVAGSIFSRFFKREVSESVTQIGAWLIKMTAQAAVDKHQLTILFGDTDSGGMSRPGFSEDDFRAFVNWCNIELYPDAVVPTGADKKYISLAFEKTFALMISVVKKTYAGRLLHKKGKRAGDADDPVIKGLEYKRGDSAKLARGMQEEIVKMILMTGKPLPREGEYPVTPKDIEAIVERVQQHVLGAKFELEDAVVAQRITKNIDSYGGKKPDGSANPIPGHVRVAASLIARGYPIYPGVKVEYVVADGKASPQKLMAAIDATVTDVDLYHLWEAEVWPATERVVMACFPGHPWKRWGAVRPKKGVLPGQMGLGFGERVPLATKKKRSTSLI